MTRAVLKTLLPEDLDPKVGVVVGTRPGIVMMSPIVRELQSRGVPFFLLHTGQHYSENMDAQFFDDLELPQPTYRLERTAATTFHGAQTAEMLRGSEEVLLEERPRLVLVGGDANTNLAAALAARKLHMRVGHVEAGERSYDWRMPEEHNRVVIDHMSEYLFATNEKAAENLRADAVRGRIVVSGNPIVDATVQNLELAVKRSTVREDLGLRPRGYLVMTLHREENVDREEVLSNVIDAAERLTAEHGEPIVFAAHPRTANRIREFGLSDRLAAVPGLQQLDALGYLDFLGLLAEADLVLTDSGGVQQEACIVRVPCVTVRENTEWTETIDLGANVLAGVHPQRIVESVRTMRAVSRNWLAPFGDGRAAARIVDVAREAVDGDDWEAE